MIWFWSANIYLKISTNKYFPEHKTLEEILKITPNRVHGVRSVNLCTRCFVRVHLMTTYIFAIRPSIMYQQNVAGFRHPTPTVKWTMRLSSWKNMFLCLTDHSLTSSIYLFPSFGNTGKALSYFSALFCQLQWMLWIDKGGNLRTLFSQHTTMITHSFAIQLHQCTWENRPFRGGFAYPYFVRQTYHLPYEKTLKLVNVPEEER